MNLITSLNSSLYKTTLMKPIAFLFSIFTLSSLMFGLNAQNTAQNNSDNKIEVLSKDVISSGGKNLSSENLKMTFTLGEISVGSNNEDQNINAQQGFQIPRITVIKSQNIANKTELNPLELEISVYPNPSSDFINIALDPQEAIVFYRVFDNTGQMIVSDEIPAYQNSSKIDVRNLPNSTYFLNLHDKNGNIISNFKILKTD